MMMTQSHDTETARRIVAINGELMRVRDKERRERLTAEQRTLWEAQFDGLSYDEILQMVH